MPEIGKVLKDEIARIAQREAAQTVKALNLTTAKLQKELAALRQELTKKAAPAPAAEAKAPAKQKLGVKPAKTPAKGKKLAPKPVKATPAAEATVSVEAAGPAVTFTAASVKALPGLWGDYPLAIVHDTLTRPLTRFPSPIHQHEIPPQTLKRRYFRHHAHDIQHGKTHV